MSFILKRTGNTLCLHMSFSGAEIGGRSEQGWQRAALVMETAYNSNSLFNTFYRYISGWYTVTRDHRQGGFDYNELPRSDVMITVMFLQVYQHVSIWDSTYRKSSPSWLVCCEDETSPAVLGELHPSRCSQSSLFLLSKERYQSQKV